MSKMLEATCVGGVVTSGGVPVIADKICKGVGASTGVLFLDEDKAKYIATSADDLKSSLDQISTALTQIAAALTILDAKPIGTLPPAPGAAANITAITTAQAAIATLKEILK